MGKQWDVGVDNNNYLPVSMKLLESIMEDRPDNSTNCRRKRIFNPIGAHDPWRMVDDCSGKYDIEGAGEK